MTLAEFSRQVGEMAFEQYDIMDGSDLCYNLVEMGVIDMSEGIGVAAMIVARHHIQA